MRNMHRRLKRLTNPKTLKAYEKLHYRTLCLPGPTVGRGDDYARRDGSFCTRLRKVDAHWPKRHCADGGDGLAENGVRRFTTTLQAVVDERPAPVREPQAFLAVGAEGRAYLVGSGVRPMPLVTVQDIHPDRTSERAACTLTITLLAAHGALLAKSFKNIKPLITDENK